MYYICGVSRPSLLTESTDYDYATGVFSLEFRDLDHPQVYSSLSWLSSVIIINPRHMRQRCNYCPQCCVCVCVCVYCPCSMNSNVGLCCPSVAPTASKSQLQGFQPALILLKTFYSQGLTLSPSLMVTGDLCWVTGCTNGCRYIIITHQINQAFPIFLECVEKHGKTWTRG